MSHYTTMSSVRQCMTTTAALDEGVGRLATHERLRLSVNTILNTRSDRTRAAQVHHFRLRPARLAANHARHDHSVFAMPMPHGTSAGSKTPRSITTLVASSDRHRPSVRRRKRARAQPTYSVASSEGFLLRRLHRRPSRAVLMALTLCALRSFVETQAPKPISPCHQPVP
jgi:hypothetical protein